MINNEQENEPETVIVPNFCYDVEVFPNFFSVTFVNIANDTTLVFVIFEEINHLNDLREFVQNHVQWLIGYNSSKYDDIILRYLLTSEALSFMTPDEITDIIYKMSVEIIGTQRNGMSIFKLPHLKPYVKDDPSIFASVDLMSMMYFDKKKISLKKVGVAMQWPIIQDLPKKYNEHVRRSELPEILKYNKNDVDITKELMRQQKDELQIRIDIGNLYNLNLMSRSRSSMADMLMAKFWSEETGQKYWDFKDLRTTYESIPLSECLSPKIGFKSPVLKKLHEDIKNTIWTSKTKFEHRVVVNQTAYDVLLGGLHSLQPPMVIESDNEYDLIDLDVNIAAS